MKDKKFSIEDLMKLRTSSGNEHLEPADFNRLLDEVAHMQKKLQDQASLIDNLKEDAATDPLTSLSNRRLFDKELERALASAQRYGRTHALLMIDVNDFKVINDTLGHQTGDNVLIHIARLISQNTRPTDVVARLGGDEFCVILNELKVAENAAERAKDLQDIINQTPYIGPKNTVPVSISIGFYAFGAEDDVEKILRKADENMYQQKQKTKY